MGSVYTVGQINSYIKMMFSQDFLLNRVSVKGEISNCKYHGSGHIYFSLKDETGAISCVMFAGSRKNLSFRLENGQRVVAAGSVGNVRLNTIQFAGYPRDERRYTLWLTGLLWRCWAMRQQAAGEGFPV